MKNNKTSGLRLENTNLKKKDRFSKVKSSAILVLFYFYIGENPNC